MGSVALGRALVSVYETSVFYTPKYLQKITAAESRLLILRLFYFKRGETIKYNINKV